MSNGFLDSAIGGAFGSLVTAVMTYITIRGQSRQVRLESLRRHLADSYVVLQGYIGAWADRVSWERRKILIEGDEGPEIPHLSPGDIDRASLFVSDEVKSKLVEFNVVLGAYHSAAQALAVPDKGVIEDERLNASKQVDVAAKAVSEAAAEVHKCLRADVLGPQSSWWRRHFRGRKRNEAPKEQLG